MESTVKSFDVELCFRQSYDVYRSNFLVFILASLAATVLGVCTLGILMGPLQAGLFMMILKKLRTGETPKFDELFNYFNHFGRFVLLFYILFICTLIGFLIVIVPGILVLTIFMYSFLIACDKDMYGSDTLGQSYRLVTTNVFWKHLVLMIMILALLGMASSIPHVGKALWIPLIPLTYGIIASAYHQLLDENPVKETVSI